MNTILICNHFHVTASQMGDYVSVFLPEDALPRHANGRPEVEARFLTCTFEYMPWVLLSLLS